MTDNSPYPISRPVAITELLHGDPKQIVIDADDAERQALADYLDIPEVRSLKAKVTLRGEPGRTFVLEGTVDADLTQSCVVTLNPVETHIAGPIRRVFRDFPEESEDPEMDPFDEDAPDEVEGGQIDVGIVRCLHLIDVV